MSRLSALLCAKSKASTKVREASRAGFAPRGGGAEELDEEVCVTRKAGGWAEEESGVEAVSAVEMMAVPVSIERFKESLMVESSASDMMAMRVGETGRKVSGLSGQDGKVSGSLFTGERRRGRKELEKDGVSAVES